MNPNVATSSNLAALALLGLLSLIQANRTMADVRGPLRIVTPGSVSETVSRLTTGTPITWLCLDSPYSHLRPGRLRIATDEYGQRSARVSKDQMPIIGLVKWKRRSTRVPTALYQRGDRESPAYPILFSGQEFVIELRTLPHESTKCEGCSEFHHSVVLKTRGTEQELLRKMDTAYLSIDWAGDLDGDGRIDLVLGTGHTHGGTRILYLSTGAGEGKLVREAARDKHSCGC